MNDAWSTTLSISSCEKFPIRFTSCAACHPDGSGIGAIYQTADGAVTGLPASWGAVWGQAGRG
ncbi:MAG: hypothetical protein ABIN58_10715, partial [candidate division WOR-3 bacterium]